jgi:hypothetical protein
MKGSARLLLVLLALVAAPRFAHAWDPATTHDGMTERAAAVSTLHATLVHDLDRALGIFEPLRLDFSLLDRSLARSLKARLETLDPAGGCRPSPDGVATASAWLRAGAVLAKTPPERGRNHFLEPGSRSGLDDGGGLSGTLYSARLTLDEGTTVRDTATGLAFDLEGMSALEWVHSSGNDLGLAAFLEQWALATSATEANQRDTALARALLALGGTLAVLEDMGQPAYVRNDFRTEFLSHDTGSVLERFVADRYGAVGLPAPSKPVVRPDFDSYFVALDGKGLAQATQQRFFSTGTLPQDLSIDARESNADITSAANRTLRFGEPGLSTLDIRQDGKTRYVVRDGARLLAYECSGNRVRFFLDERVRQDLARRWLPEVEAYAAGMVDHLLRRKLQIKVADGKADIAVAGWGNEATDEASSEGLVGKSIHVLVEDAAGKRREIVSRSIAAEASPLSIRLPSDARKVAAFVRSDGADGFVASAEARLP